MMYKPIKVLIGEKKTLKLKKPKRKPKNTKGCLYRAQKNTKIQRKVLRDVGIFHIRRIHLCQSSKVHLAVELFT